MLNALLCLQLSIDLGRGSSYSRNEQQVLALDNSLKVYKHSIQLTGCCSRVK
jgi:hypothetical protein